MKSFIRQILKEELSNREVLLFNKVNSKLKELKVKSNILKYIEDTSKVLGLDPNIAQYYYLLWKANYRKEGDYGKISPEEFIGNKKLPQRVMSNTRTGAFSKGKAPFKGSNLEGRWETDNKGVDYYVIISYRWYPIYLFKEDKWYKASNTYSSSTSRQMSNVNPVEYDEEIGRDVIWVTKDEMDALRNYATYEDIMKGKVKGIVKKKEQFINKKPKFAKNWTYNGDGETPIKARFKVTDIREEGDKAVIDITIDDAGTREKQPSRHGGMETTNRMVPSKGGYLRGEVEGVTKEKVETIIKNHIMHNFKDYVGRFPNWSNDTYDLEATPEKHAIKFNFIHTNAQ